MRKGTFRLAAVRGAQSLYARPGASRAVTSRRAACLVLAASLFLLASCKKEAGWQTDYDAALKDAEAKGRSVLALFSGEDWDGRTQTFRTDVLDTDEFKEFVKDSYVLLNVDLSEAEQAAAIPKEGADEKEQAEAARVQAGIDTKLGLIRRYGVSSYPSLYLLSKEGYVLSIVQYSEGLTAPSVLKEILEEQEEGIAAVSAAISRMQASSGADKVRAIDQLYEATPEAGRAVLAPLVKEVPSLDPGDVSGLVGKYEFIRTYDEAIANISEGKRDGVVESFVAIAEGGHLSPAQKLEAYYNAAYLMALFGEDDYDRMYELLQKAMESDPAGNMQADSHSGESAVASEPAGGRMEKIAALMKMVAQMRDIVGQDGGVSPGAGASGPAAAN